MYYTFVKYRCIDFVVYFCAWDTVKIYWLAQSAASTSVALRALLRAMSSRHRARIWLR